MAGETSKLAGLTTLGITFGYCIETTAGTMPTTGYTQLSRISSVGGINIEYEQIDLSALEDKTSRYGAGRGDTGGSVNVGVLITGDTMTEWSTLASAYSTAASANKKCWFAVNHPTLDKSFVFSAIPPTTLPMPESNQNEAWSVEMVLTVEEYKGAVSKVTFASAS